MLGWCNGGTDYLYHTIYNLIIATYTGALYVT